MDPKEQKLIAAAFAVFSRYGIKRSTMNDIAAEAGVARQTLYNSFANKDDVLRGLIRFYHDRAMAEIEAGRKDAADLGAQLDLLFRHLAIAAYDMMSETPHAAEIQDGFTAAGQSEHAEGARRFHAVIEEILQPYGPQISAAGHNLPRLAEIVLLSAKAAKSNATSRGHLLELLETLKTMVLGIATQRG